MEGVGQRGLVEMLGYRRKHILSVRSMATYTEYSKATKGKFSSKERSAHMIATARGDDKLQIGCHPSKREKREEKLLFR